jgi:hypothetical protein
VRSTTTACQEHPACTVVLQSTEAELGFDPVVPAWALDIAPDARSIRHHEQGLKDTAKTADRSILVARATAGEAEDLLGRLDDASRQTGEQFRATEERLARRIARAEAAEEKLRLAGDRVERFTEEAEKVYGRLTSKLDGEAALLKTHADERFLSIRAMLERSFAGVEEDYARRSRRIVSQMEAAASRLERRAIRAEATLNRSREAAQQVYDRIEKVLQDGERRVVLMTSALDERLSYAGAEIGAAVERMIRRANQGVGRLAQVRGELRKELEDLLRSSEAMTERLKNEIEAVKAKHRELIEMVGDRV